MNAPLPPPMRVDRAVVGPRAVVSILGLLVLVLTVASIAVGYAPFDVPAAAGDLIAGRATLPALVLWELRLPRALLGSLVGFSLGLTGAAMQGYCATRSPIPASSASPPRRPSGPWWFSMAASQPRLA